MTRNFWFRRWIMVLFLALGLAMQQAQAAVEKIPPDPKGIELVNKFLEALSIEDAGKRLKAVLPLVHKSLRNDEGTDLDRNIKEFSYKKAVQNVNFYQQPANIEEVHKGRDVTIGFQNTAEQGRTDKYFVPKKEGVAGRPAPLHVFWPKDGGAPSIVNMGSL